MGFLSDSNLMSFRVYPFLILFVFISFSTISFIAADDTPSAYDMLQQFGFPRGILPQGVVGYGFDNQTGQFSVNWKGSCSFSLENSYQLKYKSTITGVISNKKIKNLKGVSVKVLLFWLNIVEVIRDRDDLQFSVGIASADFPVVNFEECPQCGCGLDCNKLKSNPLVSSS